jgi:hypothetical protein
MTKAINIIERNFNEELRIKEAEIEQLDNLLAKTQKVLQLVRYAAVTKKYSNPHGKGHNLQVSLNQFDLSRDFTNQRFLTGSFNSPGRQGAPARKATTWRLRDPFKSSSISNYDCCITSTSHQNTFLLQHITKTCPCNRPKARAN